MYSIFTDLNNRMYAIDKIKSELGNCTLRDRYFLKFQRFVDFENIKSELICIEYSNKLFISVTSSGVIGSLLYLRTEKNPENNFGTIIYSVKTLFGKSEESIQTFARSLVEKLRINNNITKPIIISVGLKKEHIHHFSLLKFYENIIVKFYSDQNGKQK